MRRALKVRMRPRIGTRASGRYVDLLRRHLAWLQNLGDIATPSHMRTARAMAALAGRPRATMGQVFLECGLSSELLYLVGMAGRRIISDPM